MSRQRHSAAAHHMRIPTRRLMQQAQRTAIYAQFGSHDISSFGGCVPGMHYCGPGASQEGISYLFIHRHRLHTNALSCLKQRKSAWSVSKQIRRLDSLEISRMSRLSLTRAHSWQSTLRVHFCWHTRDRKVTKVKRITHLRVTYQPSARIDRTSDRSYF